MGGPGSGSWYRWRVDRKRTVEESLVLSMRQLRRHLYTNAVVAVQWRWSSGGESGVLVTINWGDEPSVTLAYRWGGVEDVRLRVALQATPMRFGGYRWWFTCPLTRRGVPCRRRVAKLYLPPRGRLFGCRSCHNLSYKSAQQAHHSDRVLSRLGLEPGDERLLSTWDDFGR